jgi:hypothetical protein
MANSELVQEQTDRDLLLVFATTALFPAAFTIHERNEPARLFPNIFRLAFGA